MELSDAERISKVYYGISTIVSRLDALSDHAGEFQTRNLVMKLKRLSRELWPVLLGRSCSGGDAHNVVTLEEYGPWSIAIRQVANANRSEEEPRQEYDEFNPFDGFLDVNGLLNDETVRAVYEVYCTTEIIAHALRCYDDELSRRFEALNHLVAEIQGTCYMVFEKDDTYTKAYVLSRVMRGIYTGTRERIVLDTTGKKLNKLYMHHDLSRPMSDATMREILAFDKELGRNPSIEKRLLVAMKCAGRRFYYDHQFATLIKLFGEKFRPILEPEFLKNKAAHNAREDENQKRYGTDSDESADYALHGESLAPYKAIKAPKKRRK